MVGVIFPARLAFSRQPLTLTVSSPMPGLRIKVLVRKEILVIVRSSFIHSFVQQSMVFTRHLRTSFLLSIICMTAHGNLLRLKMTLREYILLQPGEEPGEPLLQFPPLSNK